MGIGRSILNMFDIAKYHKRTKDGSNWYLQSLLGGDGDSLRSLMGGKKSFDMTKDKDKALSLSVCTPVSTVIDKIGSMFARGKYYVVDDENNEVDRFNEVRELLKKPNLLQSGIQFSKQVEMCLKLFGYCPVFTLRATAKSLPRQMWIIPPELFHVELTGKIFKQTKLEDVIKRSYISWNAGQLELTYGKDYFIIYDSEICIGQSELSFRAATDSLSAPVTLWVNQMIASNTLIVDGGPKGIIYNDDNSEFGNAAMTPSEKEELNEQFKNNYGLVNKAFSILVSKVKLGWLPLNYDSSQLKLHEEDVRCTNKICNAIGLNPNIFSSDSKYENQEASERKAYTSLVIPDSEIICEALTEALGVEGGKIYLDYSHVECLQSDKKEEASTKSLVSTAVSKLFNEGLLTKDEVRDELSKYFDIDPDKPRGEFKEGNNKDKDNESGEVQE